MVQNAGISPGANPIEYTSLEEFRQVLDVNLVGPFLCTREAVKIFKGQQPPGGELFTLHCATSNKPSDSFRTHYQQRITLCPCTQTS